ncbi:hypothetical protein [Sphaerisporangium sp. TRM90804]|uniref:hypothetical protein n=1 Tax=Sphaerisporangium sp. TRM90804 TaxID=3031113 RepID=UPI00244753A1|nr:hypothetical protein [Sphaerisporangium sp. TRM90804]MDH2429294.1 hypothetical protein [Sphaerisporangium sp. TRM90804]
MSLGELCGFGMVKPLPGIADWELNTAVTLPIGVETYAAYALGTWLSHSRRVGDGTRAFAKWSSMGALGLGMLGQVAYHLLVTKGLTTAPPLIVTAVSCLPVLVLGVGAVLGHMLARDAHASPAVVVETATTEPEVHPDPIPEPSGYTPPAAAVPVSREVYDWAAEIELFDQPPVVVASEPVEVPEIEPPAGDVPDEPEYVPGDVPEELRRKAASRFLPHVVTGSLPGVRQLKTELGIGQDRAQQVRAYLSTLASQ